MSASTSPVFDDGGGTGSSGRRGYDVFLSFRGEDTRLSFTDHLYSALVQRGITTFRDEESLEGGAPIQDRLFSAIDHSRFCVVVFSRNYASSSWCLGELEKIHGRVKSKVQPLPTILPVFYDVDPSHVRKQRGDYAAAFAEHERIYGEDSATVIKWRKALKAVANLSGWDLRGKHQAEEIQKIVREIFLKLSSELPSELQIRVGIEPRAKKLLEKLSDGSDDSCIVGIVGMGGIGKTTIARFVYEKICGGFNRCSFLANIRETMVKKGILSLQERLLRDVLKDETINIPDVNRGVTMIGHFLRSLKVLIVLDDVDDGDQLEALAGSNHWFGPGSRIIVTTRDVHLLMERGGDIYFCPEKLDDDEALRLFSLRAFKEDDPPEPYLELSRSFVKYSRGLPLAVTVLGSFLYARSIDEWRSMLTRLKKAPLEKITDVLKVSFDGLEGPEKEMFLDIACFFNGEDEDRVIRIWDACKLDPQIGLRVLRDKCLISDKRGKLRMHDLLRQMGKEIVRGESPKEPGRRSRLWRFEDAQDVLENNEGSGSVQGIYLPESSNKYAKRPAMSLRPEAFKKMRRLRFLKLMNGNIPKGLHHLPNKLRYFEWHDYRSMSLPLDFHPRNLVELRLPYSHITALDIGPKPLKNLTHLDLSYSTRLIQCPDFSLLPNLEEIILTGCVRLSIINQSIDVVKRLRVLELSGCKALGRHRLPRIQPDISSQRIQPFIGLIQPASLYIKSFQAPAPIGRRHSEYEGPFTVCKEEMAEDLKKRKAPGVKKDEEKDENAAGLKKTPGDKSFLEHKGQEGRRSHLARENPRGTDHRWLDILSYFHFLRNLDLSNCDLPDYETTIDLSCLSSLQNLDLKDNRFTRVPFDISGLHGLVSLWLSYCQNLEILPELPRNVQMVAANHCTELRALPDHMGLDCSEQCDISFINCPKLAGGRADGLTKSILQKLLQIVLKEPDRGRTFNFYLPGTEVPRWFICRSTGAMLTLHLYRGFQDDSLKGFVICAVFLPGAGENGSFCSYDFSYGIGSDDVEESSSTSFVALKSYGAIQSEHLWVSYMFRRQWASRNVDPGGIRNRVTVRFRSFDPDTKVIGCGIHPLW